MPTPSCQLILGSASPRRQELLKWTWLPFEVMLSRAPEHCALSSAPEKALELAKQKGRDVFEQARGIYSCPIVIGADTIVANGDQALEKPKDRADARRMLLELSDRRHHVYTGVAIVHPRGEIAFVEKTVVRFDSIDPDLLELYLDSGESLDKAGAYGVQGAAQAFIAELEGSYSNVVGLPVNRVLLEIKRLAQDLCPGAAHWRSCFEV